LYLTFHGGLRGSGRGRERVLQLSEADDGEISLNELASILGTNLTGVIIHFGSCSLLRERPKVLQGFLHATGAKALVGYTADVEDRRLQPVVSCKAGARERRGATHSGHDTRLQDLPDLTAARCGRAGSRRDRGRQGGRRGPILIGGSVARRRRQLPSQVGCRPSRQATLRPWWLTSTRAAPAEALRRRMLFAKSPYRTILPPTDGCAVLIARAELALRAARAARSRTRDAMEVLSDRGDPRRRPDWLQPRLARDPPIRRRD
jgi:hypothetical protein